MKNRWYILFILPIVAFIIFFFSVKPSRIAVVTKVIDGDTLVITGDLRVRLIGVDTPEHDDIQRNLRNARRMGVDPPTYEAYSEESLEFVRDLVVNQAIRLEYDPANESIGHQDPHGRLLAYVWLESPFVYQPPPWAVFDQDPQEKYPFSLNASLIKAGYSFAKTRYPYHQRSAYQAYEADAKAHKRGFWQKAK